MTPPHRYQKVYSWPCTLYWKHLVGVALSNLWLLHLMVTKNLSISWIQTMEPFSRKRWTTILPPSVSYSIQEVKKYYFRCKCIISFLNGPTSASFVFSNTQKFYNKVCEKRPSSIWCRDSNSWPLEHESPPITIRPGFLPMCNIS